MPSLAGGLLAVPAVALLLLLFASSASAVNFTCAGLGTTCNSAIGYAVPNATTYAELVVRFNTTTTLADLLGANGLLPTTASSTPISAKTVVRVPFRCLCGSNAVGESVDGPIYVVQPMDSLDHIARDVFDAFVTYQEIATANSITDLNLIQVDQKLRIPLPCTCDQVDGADVMHLAYSVAKGDDPPGIAAKFGVTENTLLIVNKITDPMSLQLGQILDVPLPVCNSSIDHISADHDLLLPYGTYASTAQGCVQCSCRTNSTDDHQLDCVPVQGYHCPAVPACTGALNLGQDCGSKMCAYEGYLSDSTSSLTIYTTLVPTDKKTSPCLPNVSAGPSAGPLSGGPRRQNKLILKVALSASSCLILTCLACTIYHWKKIYHVYNGSIRSKNRCDGNASNIENILKGYDSLIPKRYKYSEVKKITGSFKHILGEGGYGIVYKGKLEDGRNVAVKLLKGSKGNGEEFLNEVVSIRRTSHINIVNLVGFCLQGSKRGLIYDYMVNGSLDKYIYSEETKMAIGWDKLREIALGIRRGLEYLHRGCNARIIHFDIKPHNVLLDEDFCPKIADFGLAKLCHLKDSALSMAEARGTIGFIAPEVFSRGFGVVSTKSDVYSYGMVLLEMVVGRKNIKETTGNSSEAYFPDWIYDRLAKDLQSQEVACESDETARHMTLVALWCIQTSPGNRPSIRSVIDMLEKNIGELEMPPKPFLSCPSLPSYFSCATID